MMSRDMNALQRLSLWIISVSMVSCALMDGARFFCVTAAAMPGDFIYEGKGKRDPFLPLVGRDAVRQMKELADVRSIDDLSLGGILYDKRGGSLAIVNGSTLKEGAQQGSFTLIQIRPDRVDIVLEGSAYQLFLNGEKKGGETK